MKELLRILDIYKREGFWAALWRALRKFGRMIFETNSAFWFEKYLSGPIQEIAPKIPVEINFFSSEETINWLKNKGENWMFNPAEIKVGLEENHYYVNIKYGNEIIGYTKVGLGKVFIDDYKKILPLRQGSAFLYDMYIDSRYRKNNIGSFTIAEIMKFLRNMNIKEVRCHIPAWNIPSLNMIEKNKFKKAAYIRYFRILGIIKFWVHRNGSMFEFKVWGLI